LARRRANQLEVKLAEIAHDDAFGSDAHRTFIILKV